MEGCLLCLELNKELVDSIKADSTKWQEQNFQHLIEKHLWIMEPIVDTSWVCLSCWQTVQDFHKYYMRIEEAHIEFGKLLKTETKDSNFDKNDLIFESHLEPEILIDQLTMDDSKPIIKKELDEDLDEDNVPLVQRISTKDNSNNTDSLANEDPLKKSKRKRPTKSKKIKKEQKEQKEQKELKEPKIPELKQDLNGLNDKPIMSSDDGGDFDDQADIDFIPEKETKRSKRSTNKKATKREENTSDSDGSNTDFEYKPEAEEEALTNNNKLPKLTYKQKDLFLTENYKMSCIHCKTPMENFRTLLKHFEDNHDGHGYAVCCNKKFYERGKLLKHVWRHGESGNYDFKLEDDDANKQVKPSFKEKDKFLAENFKMSCVLCEIPMENFRTLIKHFETEHNDKRGYAVCCKKKFHERGKLIDHIHRHMAPDNFKCNICGRALSSQKALQNHQLIHLSDEDKKIPCNECDKFFADQSLLLKHVNIVHLRKYAKICDICGKSLRCGEPFQRHMLEHEGKPLPTISCDVCGLKVSTKHGLRRHKSIRHPAVKQTQTCPICFKISPNIRAQREHIRRVHSANNSFVCSMCGRGFKRPLALKEHMATHTGIALYTCPWCPKTFNANGGLHAHRKRQHPVEWEQQQRDKMLKYTIPPVPENLTLPDINNTNFP